MSFHGIEDGALPSWEPNYYEEIMHKNAEIICAWVRGFAIEVQSPTTDEWYDVPAADKLGIDDDFLLPHPLHPDYDYMNFRVKRDGI